MDVTKATTLLGIRNIEVQIHKHITEKPNFASLEEPFAFLHTAVAHTIMTDRHRIEAGGAPCPMHRLWLLARRELLRQATAHRRTLEMQHEARNPEEAGRKEARAEAGSLAAFDRDWIQQGGLLHRTGQTKFPFTLVGCGGLHSKTAKLRARRETKQRTHPRDDNTAPHTHPYHTHPTLPT